MMSGIFLLEQIFLGKEKEVQRKFYKQNFINFFFFFSFLAVFALIGDFDDAAEQNLSKKCFSVWLI